MQIKKIFSGLTILTVVLGLSYAPPAKAAAPTGTLTSTAITVNIGQILAINTLNITDTNGEITAANDICIRIKAGTNADWDVADTAPTFGGTASGKVAAAVTYPDAKTLKIDVTADFAVNDTLTIDDLSYIGHTATSGAAPLQWAIDNTDCSVATYGDADTSTNITVADGAEDTLTGIVATPANPASGVTTNYTIDFTVPTNGVIPANGKILIDFPDDFDVSGVTFDSATGIDGTFTLSTAAGAVITLTRNNDGANSLAGAKQVVLNTIVNSTTVGTTKTLDVTTRTNGDNLLATGTSASFTIDPDPITDLACVSSGMPGAIWLTWTVPQINPTGYVVKYSLANITNDVEFNAATTYTQTWAAGTAGSSKQELVMNLNPNVTYFFNVKVTAAGNALSRISNTGVNCVAPTQAAPSDATAPTSLIIDPEDGATILAGQDYTVKGTSSDEGGSSVKKMEISLDGGETWAEVTPGEANENSGFDWEYVWLNPQVGEYNLRTRATDWFDNVETPGAGINVTVAEAIPEEMPPPEEAPPPEEEEVPPPEEEVPIEEMTTKELEERIAEVQQQIISLLQQLIELIQEQISQLLGS